MEVEVEVVSCFLLVVKHNNVRQVVLQAQAHRNTKQYENYCDKCC